MLADSKLPTTFWAKAVNTVCYVQNRVLVTKPHNKTPYEIFLGRKPALGFMRPFGYPVTILNTIDHLGKFDGKVDEGFFIRYSINSKAFRVFNSRTRIVEENMHVQFSENIPNIVGSRPNWLFDIDALTKSMNYKPVVTGNQSNGNTGTKACDNVGKARMETLPGDNEKKVTAEPGKEGGDPSNKNDSVNSTNNINTASDGNSTNNVNTVNSTVNTACIEVNVVSSNTSIELPNDLDMPELEDIVYSDDYEDKTKKTVRRNLQLDDEEGTDCLPNTTIFEELTRMGAKTTAWNEFSSTMASAIICLATNQKFNFSKYIFESMVKNLDNAGSEVPTDPHHTPIITQPSSSQPQKKQKSRRPKEKDTHVPQISVPSDPTNIVDEAVHEEPSMQLKELMDFCTKLQQRVLDLKNTKTAQA
ncbi:ribonuclease H-like domain-containing protein [Tanacetum coccineum]